MLQYPDLDATVALWGAAVLTYAAIRYYFFDGCIQIDLPVHHGRGAQTRRERK